MKILLIFAISFLAVAVPKITVSEQYVGKELVDEFLKTMDLVLVVNETTETRRFIRPMRPMRVDVNKQFQSWKVESVLRGVTYKKGDVIWAIGASAKKGDIRVLSIEPSYGHFLGSSEPVLSGIGRGGDYDGGRGQMEFYKKISKAKNETQMRKIAAAFAAEEVKKIDARCVALEKETKQDFRSCVRVLAKEQWR